MHDDELKGIRRLFDEATKKQALRIEALEAHNEEFDFEAELADALDDFKPRHL